jgi:tetratricopeptide (TPR) repeat protein
MSTLNESEYLAKAQECVKNNNRTDAIAYFRQAIELNKTQPLEIVSQFANQLLQENELAEAEQHFNYLLGKNFQPLKTRAGLAQIYQKQKYWQQALDLWNSIFENSKGNAQISWYVDKGNCLLELKQFAESEMVFQQAIKDYPNLPQGYVGIYFKRS